MLQTERPRADTNTKIAQLVEQIGEIGPDIPEISRRLGQFKESVRYRYKTQLLGRGFAIQAMVDHEKLGLRRVIAVLDFAPETKQYAESILTAMSEIAYVVFFAQTLPQGDFIIQASVPQEFQADFEEFLRGMAAKGFFRITNYSSLEWYRNIPMRAESYNFDSGLWEYDWASAPALVPADAAYLPSQKSAYDETDLLLLKELQVDATRSLVDIAAALKINYKKLVWHYTVHVLNNKLIKGYRLNWMGTRYDFKVEKALHRQHRYMLMALMGFGLSQQQRMELATKVHKVPFLWAEAVSETNYYAELFLPVDAINEALQYLYGAVSVAKENLWYSFLDQSKALSFTFSYRMFDAEKRAWTFDKEALLNKFDNLLIEIGRAR
jgi:DNA-binding Lrp family transcriptional regulator